MRSFKIKIFLIVVISGFLLGQVTPTITNLALDVKRNGIFVQLRTTSPVEEKDITGWATEKGWFYMTILGAISDTASINRTKLKYPVTAIQVTNTGESTQIALKLDLLVENFEFYQSDNPPEILLSMRFPIEDVLAFLEEEKQGLDVADAGNEVSEETGKKVHSNSVKQTLRYKKIRTVLYLFGTSLTIAGILDQDNKNSSGWELPTGLSIMVGTYLFDTVIYPKLTTSR